MEKLGCCVLLSSSAVLVGLAANQESFREVLITSFSADIYPSLQHVLVMTIDNHGLRFNWLACILAVELRLLFFSALFRIS